MEKGMSPAERKASPAKPRDGQEQDSGLVDVFNLDGGEGEKLPEQEEGLAEHGPKRQKKL